MKNVYLVMFLFILASPLFGQEKLLDILPLKDGKVYYSDVIVNDSVKKDLLYIRSKQWFVKTFNSANDVVQLDDKDAGKISDYE